jgi:hypothetical protein
MGWKLVQIFDPRCTDRRPDSVLTTVVHLWGRRLLKGARYQPQIPDLPLAPVMIDPLDVPISSRPPVRWSSIPISQTMRHGR